LSRTDLLQLGAGLGADVPVFLFGQNAFAQGAGERLTAVTVPDCAYLLVQPDAFVATADVFAAPDLTRNSEAVKITDFAAWLEHGTKQGHEPFGRNDLEPAVLAQYPNVRLAAGFMGQHLGEQGLQVRMTGSGACLFAACETLEQAQAGQQKIVAKIAQCGIGSGADRSGIRQTWACSGLPEHPLKNW